MYLMKPSYDAACAACGKHPGCYARGRWRGRDAARRPREREETLTWWGAQVVSSQFRSPLDSKKAQKQLLREYQVSPPSKCRVAGPLRPPWW